MTRTIAQAFDFWLEDYIANPGKYDREIDTVLRRAEELKNGEPLTYGERSAALLQHFMEGGE